MLISNSQQRSLCKLTTVLDASDVVLSSLTTAARACCIPYLQDAAQLVLSIVNIIKTVKGNKDAFERLAKDACELVYAILTTAVDVPMSTELVNICQELVRKLVEIERFATKNLSRGTVSRTLTHKSDLDTIREYRESLRQSLDVFVLKSSITTQGTIARIERSIRTGTPDRPGRLTERNTSFPARPFRAILPGEATKLDPTAYDLPPRTYYSPPRQPATTYHPPPPPRPPTTTYYYPPPPTPPWLDNRRGASIHYIPPPDPPLQKQMQPRTTPRIALEAEKRKEYTKRVDKRREDEKKRREEKKREDDEFFTECQKPEKQDDALGLRLKEISKILDCSSTPAKASPLSLPFSERSPFLREMMRKEEKKREEEERKREEDKKREDEKEHAALKLRMKEISKILDCSSTPAKASPLSLPLFGESPFLRDMMRKGEKKREEERKREEEEKKHAPLKLQLEKFSNTLHGSSTLFGTPVKPTPLSLSLFDKYPFLRETLRKEKQEAAQRLQLPVNLKNIADSPFDTPTKDMPPSISPELRLFGKAGLHPSFKKKSEGWSHVRYRLFIQCLFVVPLLIAAHYIYSISRK